MSEKDLEQLKREAVEKAKAAAAAKAKAAAAAKAKAAALAKQQGADSDAGAAAIEAAGEGASDEEKAASASAAAAFQAEGATALPEGTDDKAKAIAAAKAKAAAAAKAKAAAAAKAGDTGAAASGDDEKAKAIAAAKAKAAAAAAAKAKAGGATGAGGDDDKAKAIAAAKAKAAALAKAKTGDTGATAEAAQETPSPNQPLLDKYIKVIEDHLGKDVLEDAYINKLSEDVPTLVAKPETYYKVAEFLKYNEQLGFDYLSEHHGSDFETHLEVYNHLYSYKNRQTVALKVKFDRDKSEIDSLTPLWPGADWPERESYDLLGIKYLNHPNLTRIMLADDWVGHPLRKDYEQYDVEV